MWYTEPPDQVDPTVEEFYMRAWVALDRERPPGYMAPGQIPYASMVWYAERAGIEGADVNDFCAIMSALDDDYLQQVLAKIEQANKPSVSTHRHRK